MREPDMIRDADIEMAEMHEVGNRIAALERQGVCVHTSWFGYHRPIYYPEQEGLRPGQVRCAHCKTIFDSEDDLLEAYGEALS
jgi:hypothetical protein